MEPTSDSQEEPKLPQRKDNPTATDDATIASSEAKPDKSDSVEALRTFVREIATEVKKEDTHPIEKLLKQLGTIASIGGVITLAGTSVGLTPRTIAAMTLGSVLALYTLIYRERLHRRLHGGFVVLIFVTIGTFSFVLRDHITNIWLSQTLTEATGIVEYTPRANDFLPRLQKLIDNAQDEIWLMGISFYITLPQYKEQLEQRVRDGVNVRFLVYDPLAKNLDEVAAGFSQTRAELEPECRVTVSHLLEMDDQLAKTQTKGSFEVRLFSSVPKARIYIFDRHSEGGFTYFIPHVDNRNSPLVPGFLAKNIKNGIAPAYHESAVALWKASISLGDWRKVHPEFK
jgi:hypothetical protein